MYCLRNVCVCVCVCVCERERDLVVQLGATNKLWLGPPSPVHLYDHFLEDVVYGAAELYCIL